MTTEQTKMCTSKASRAGGIHVVAKPIGPVCNLNCEYCFYLEKKALFGPDEQYRMSDEVLQAFITGYISSQPTPVAAFVWKGGEPTLLGIDFFTVIGAVAGNAGKGAAIGAVAGTMIGGRQARKNKAAKEQQAEQAKTRTLQQFNKAFGVCMEGRGYIVK